MPWNGAAASQTEEKQPTSSKNEQHDGSHLPAECKDFLRPILSNALTTCRAFHKRKKPLIERLHRYLQPQQ